jgi:hypothetical protein
MRLKVAPLGCTPCAEENRPYEASDLDAIVELSLRAWQPVFESLRQVLGDAIFVRLHQPEWTAVQAEAVRRTDRGCSMPRARCWSRSCATLTSSWHTGEKFSKHAFMGGRYTLEDARDLDLNVVRDYCMAMSFRSLGDLKALESVDD